VTSLFRRAIAKPERAIATLEDYVSAVNSFYFNGNLYGLGYQNSYSSDPTEKTANDFCGYAQSLYKANGVVFACMAVRQMIFSGIRFQYQRFTGGRPGELWGDGTLAPLEKPFIGGTTQDMLARMDQDVSLAGNSYWAMIEGELIRLRPDWVDIILQKRMYRGGQVGWKRFGYIYWEGGKHSDMNPEPVAFLPDEIIHYAPEPDPEANFRGMSWLTPVIREIQADKLMEAHKRKFFENGATPNIIVRMDPGIKVADFLKFREAMDSQNTGIDDAYKTMYTAGAADITVAGADFQQMAFTTVQGRGETRIANAAGIPPVIIGLSEGLQAATYSNYSQARRRLSDGTMHPLWSNASASIENVFPVPGGSRLWYDSRDVPFLREDKQDEAKIRQTDASTLATFIQAGFEPDASVDAVLTNDVSLLKGNHTGLFSVQLQPPMPEQGEIDSDEENQNAIEAPRMLQLDWKKQNAS
jgi:phage portal protein BeeE